MENITLSILTILVYRIYVYPKESGQKLNVGPVRFLSSYSIIGHIQMLKHLQGELVTLDYRI